jgi:two-component system sensor histidine kinase TctE
MVDVQPAIDAELKKLLPPEFHELRPNEKAPSSLFGEILDWMLAPLLLLWPMSIAVTYLIAQSIANAPFDRSLENSVQAISQQIKNVDGQITLTLPMAARKILRADENDTIYFQVIGYNGELIAGDKDVPLPIEGDSLQIGLVTFRDSRIYANDVRIASTQVTLDAQQTTKVVLVQVAETLEKREQIDN